jgi:hypothetical protein
LRKAEGMKGRNAKVQSTIADFEKHRVDKK